MKTLIHTIALTLLLFPLMACEDQGKPGGTKTGSSGDRDEISITIATSDKCETTDPHRTSNGGDTKVLLQIYETLVQLNPQSPEEVLPKLAESWEVADDRLSIKFKIREGVKFHDGSPLNADACKQSLERLLGRSHNLDIAPYRTMFDFITVIDAEGMTLTIHLARPVVRVALKNLAMFNASIVSPALLQKTASMSSNEATTYISENASGTGAFVLDKLDAAAARVRLRAFDDYHGGKPQIAKINFRQIKDRNTQLESFDSGAVQILDDPPREVWQQFESDKSKTIHRWWAMNVCYLGVNVKHEKTRDFDIRRAVQLAIDRDKIIELYYDSARPTFSLVAQPTTEYDPDYRPPLVNEPLTARQAAARELIAGKSEDDKKLNLYYPIDARPYLPTPEKVADKIRQQLEQVDLDVRIVAVPNAEYFNSIKQGKYELGLIGWMSDNADPDNFYTPLTTGDPNTGKPNPNNVGRTFDPEIHKMIVEGQSITDSQKRIDIYRAIEKALQEKHIGFVPLVNTQQAIATVKAIEGIEIDPGGNYFLSKATVKTE